MDMNIKNVNQQEINHFNSQAHFWWDVNGPFKTLHHVNPTRTEYIKRFINLDTKKTLDVGCGGGVLTESLAKNGAITSGIDMAQEALEVAKLHLIESQLNIDYLETSIEDFAADSRAEFDVLVCMEMLEHVPDPQSIIDSCSKLLKPGGWLFVSTINRSPQAMLFGIFAAEHIMQIIPKGTHHYNQLIKPSELAAGIEKSGLVVIDISGLKYNPVSEKTWIDETDVTINYLIAAQKPL
jgi:2-polyprenyl-6-hydroxyphenyl methylase/3-demethylubiquinone-9 3-methyltransferase